MEIAIDCTVHYPGSIADVELFCQNAESHNEASKMYVSELCCDKSGPFEHFKDAFWANLADKGYQGAIDLFRVQQSILAPISGVLTVSQLESSPKV